MPRKLILTNHQSPGDILMLTAAVRDLHGCNPGMFVTDVRTPCPDFWLNNPWITPLSESDPEVEVIRCHYPRVHMSNQRPYHFLHGFTGFLSEILGVAVEPLQFRGDIHLSNPERYAGNELEAELSGLPYWLIASGGKFDFTIKWWEPVRYQAVVDHFAGRIRFVQTGEAHHHHPALSGVIDLRGQTSLRGLVRLMYHAAGVLCPVTMLMHLAAAVELPPSGPPVRACVVIAGGREPPHWEAYPGHRFLHTVGLLPCCATGGCWRSRVVPVGDDGDSKNHPNSLCVDVRGSLPRCMDMITADEVIRNIELYLSSGF